MAEKSLEEKVQRALDYQEIQNVFSRHAYYHAVWKHPEEIEKLWAHKTPGVSFETDQIGRIEGFEAIKAEYADTADEDGQRHLEEMIKIFPQIANKPENRHIGMAVMHTLTTPVIEVAKDGKTAKGCWVAPGHITMPRDGKMQACWFWERYGVDFVKEDGEWKIWHFRVYTDFMTPYEKSWVESAMEPHPPAPPRGRNPANAPPTWPPYKAYSPFNIPQYQPRPPEPYKTFDQTFSY